MTNDKGKAPMRPTKRPRKSRKSKDKEPTSASFTNLPSEVLALVASYLLPPTYAAQYGIAPPIERPYPGPLMITPGLIPAGERFGSVPRGVMDVVNFARVCRLTMGAAGRAMASFGGSSRPAPAKKEKSSPPDPSDLPRMAANFKQSYDDVPKRTLYIQVDHLEGKNEDNVRQFILSHRQTLEELVLYKSHFLQPRHHAKILHRLKPFQLHCPDEEVLPKLRRVQVGPKMCSACSRAALALIGGKKFYKKASPSEEEYDTSPQYAYMGWEAIDQAQVAAPQLVHLELHTSNDQQREVRETPCLTEMLARLDSSLRERLEIFTLWLRPLEMQWGGFRQQGTSSAVRGKSAQDVETELAEAVFGRKWTPAAVEQRQAANKAKEAERLAKYKVLVQTAIPRPPKRSNEGTPVDEKPSVDGAPVAPEPATLSELATKAPNGQGSRDHSPLNGQTPNGDQPRRSVSSTNPGSIYDPRKGGSQNYNAMSSGIREVLVAISTHLPNLSALRVLRSGTAMIDAIEGFHSPDEYAQWLVDPICSMKLRYLDLGLAVAGKHEVGDFPLGITLLDKTPAAIRSRTAQESQILALKAKKWNGEAKTAMEEGDQWRKDLMERLVLGREAAPVDIDDSDTPPASITKWPSTLTTGFIYSVDLENRAKRRGVIIPWTKKVTVDGGVTSEEIVWGDKQPVLL